MQTVSLLAPAPIFGDMSCEEAISSPGGGVTLPERVHPDVFARFMQQADTLGVADETIAMMKKYARLIKGNKGMAQIQYALGNAGAADFAGRLYAKGGVGIQTFPNNVIGLLCKDLVWDVDMVNAHPTILLNIAKKQGWACAELEHYVTHREAVLAEVMEAKKLNRDDAKTAMLAVFFGGSGDEIKPKLAAYVAEIKKLQVNLMKEHPHEAAVVRRSKNPNKVGATCAWILQTHERKALLAIHRELVRNGRQMSTYKHDGGHVVRLTDEEEFDAGLLRKCEAAILKDTDMDIKLAVKPLATDLVLEERESATEAALAKLICERDPIMLEHPHCIRYNAMDGVGYIYRKPHDFEQSFRAEKVKLEDGDMKSVATLWLDYPKQRRACREDFVPPPLLIHSANINTWPGFPWERTPELTNDEIVTLRPQVDLILDHIIESFCGGDTVSAEWFLRLLAKKLQQPGIKQNVAVLVVGRQGAGKDVILANFLRDRLFGSKTTGGTLAHKFSTFKEMFENFTFERGSKLMWHVEDVKPSNFAAHMEDIKQAITGQTTSFAHKGIDNQTMQDFSTLFMSADQVLPLDESDRRVAVMSASDKQKHDPAYFARLVAAIENERVVKLFAQRLLQIDVKDWHAYRNLPRTQLKRDFEAIGRCPVISWLSETAEKKTADEAPKEMITKTDALEMYVAWCEANGEHTAKLRTANSLTAKLRPFKGVNVDARNASSRGTSFDWAVIHADMVDRMKIGDEPVDPSAPPPPTTENILRMFWGTEEDDDAESIPVEVLVEAMGLLPAHPPISPLLDAHAESESLCEEPAPPKKKKIKRSHRQTQPEFEDC